MQEQNDAEYDSRSQVNAEEETVAVFPGTEFKIMKNQGRDADRHDRDYDKKPGRPHPAVAAQKSAKNA